MRSGALRMPSTESPADRQAGSPTFPPAKARCSPTISRDQRFATRSAAVASTPESSSQFTSMRYRLDLTIAQPPETKVATSITQHIVQDVANSRREICEAEGFGYQL